ncbi:MAG: protein translocase subunit SecD [Chloroflexi bacterium]|nr:protein translocase subunit SecD [Chloroflexota bacterium]
MKKNSKGLLIFILILFGFSLWVVWPNHGIPGRTGFTLGLDLQGGSRLVYSANLSEKDPALTDAQALASVKGTIERRVNAYGVSEATVRTMQNEQGSFIEVQLPGVKNIDEALKLIGQVAELDFREQVVEGGNTTFVVAKAVGSNGTEEELTGKYLKPNASVVLNQQTNEPEVAFEWNTEGALLFKQITTRNLNKPLGIFLDNELISAPTVQAVIEAKGVITGMTLEKAKTLAIQLNSGALEVPLTEIGRNDVGPTSGIDSLNKIVLAGIIGFVLIILFMIIYYRVSGLVACLALVVYTVLTLAVFRLIPVVLTLPGIAGFIVSVGMGVDGNVLVCERLKEELRSGSTLQRAVEQSFTQSWSAIWDSNVTVFIACAVLLWLGTRTVFANPTVTGFATTLFIGVALSMFTQVVVTRAFLRIVVASGLAKSPRAYGVLEA